MLDFAALLKKNDLLFVLFRRKVLELAELQSFLAVLVSDTGESNRALAECEL